MHSDRYMKIVLSVVAICLVWICVRDVTLVKPAYAEDNVNCFITGGYLAGIMDTVEVKVLK